MATDVTDLVNFANDLRAGGRVLSGGEAKSVVSKGGLNIKTGARRALRSQLSGARTSLWWLEPSITYDPPTRFGRHGWQTEVGPDQSISGLGLGTEEGSRHHAPMPFMAPATLAEEPRFYQAADALMVRAYKL